MAYSSNPTQKELKSEHAFQEFECSSFVGKEVEERNGNGNAYLLKQHKTQYSLNIYSPIYLEI